MATHTIRVPAVIETPLAMREEDEEMPVSGMMVIEVPKDMVGSTLRVEAQDYDGNLVDVSGGTGVVFHARTPDGTAVEQDLAGSYTTDGTDSLMEVDMTAALVGTERDLWCEFEVQGAGSSFPQISRLFILRIMPRAKVA